LNIYDRAKQVICSVSSLLSQPYEALILVHPQIQALDDISFQIQSLGIVHFNISKELSAALMAILTAEHGRFAQVWLKDTLARIPENPVLCSCPDLLFLPSLEIDPFTLIRQVARIKPVIVLWPGEYSTTTLSYALPEHHHYRSWKLSDSLLLQPKVLIHPISAA
jgi:hypothetical protein